MIKLVLIPNNFQYSVLDPQPSGILVTQTLRNLNKKIALILASIKVMSLLCTVHNFIDSYHERRRERPNETLATLYHKEGATFYLIPTNTVFKIDNTNT